MKVISGNKVIYKFSHEMDSIESILPGDTIKVVTNDCFFQQIFNEEQDLTKLDYNRLNPATGPIYIEGAEPGDLLKVKILSIDVKEKGISAVIPEGGVLGDQAEKPIIKMIDIIDGNAIFNGLKIPIKPMIGVIGVAPGKDEIDWPTDTPWKHGGNMDTTDIKAGSILYLPIRQKGALLCLGDCHAIMGDGEVCFTGLEIPAEVVLEIDIIKDKYVEWPMIETNTHTMIVASGDNLDKAVYEATDQAVKFIQKGLGFNWEDSYILTSLAIDIKISQLVDPKITIRSAIPKYLISTDKLIESL